MKVNYKYLFNKLSHNNIRTKKHDSSVKFLLILGSNEAKAVAPLSPIFGQFGISCQDFCKKFNEESINILSGAPVRVTLYLLTSMREFKFQITGISFIKIISMLFAKYITINELYQIYICFFYMYESEFKSQTNIIKSLKGIINSINTKVLIFKKLR